jgi:hypothetical protein
VTTVDPPSPTSCSGLFCNLASVLYPNGVMWFVSGLYFQVERPDEELPSQVIMCNIQSPLFTGYWGGIGLSVSGYYEPCLGLLYWSHVLSCCIYALIPELRSSEDFSVAKAQGPNQAVDPRKWYNCPAVSLRVSPRFRLP